MLLAHTCNVLLSLSLCLCSFTTLVSSSSRSSGSTDLLKEEHHVPKYWSRVGPAPAKHNIQIQIGLKQSQFAELEKQLYEVSDPKHHRYGKHLSQDEVSQLIRPTNESIDQILAWLSNHNISEHLLRYSPAKDWINVNLPVDSVELLLNTNFSLFRHEDGSELIRTTHWSLPRHLHQHIQTIQPTTSFFRPQPKSSTLKIVPFGSGADALTIIDASGETSTSKVCDASAVTPDCLRTLYGTIDYAVESANNSVGLVNFLGESNNRSDIHIFLEKYRPEASAAAFNFTIEVVANGDNQQTPDNSTQLAAGKDTEGNLDAETILGITWPTPLTAFSTGGMPPYLPDRLTVNDTNEPYLTWLQYILAQPEIPPVISISYGDDEQTVPYSYATAVCNGFAQLGARGVSVLFASGDNGVGPAADCFTNDGKNTETFLAQFPASCPYVTAIGATMDFNPEIVAHDPNNGFSSGGGFSNYFPMPSYQKTAVNAYIKNMGSQFKGLYNTSSRGYPDISAQGYHFETIWNGSNLILDGTSAATPTAASVITLVNDALLAAGKPVLGFLNPWIYSTANKSFTDVTVGSSVGCNTTGFLATQGWDAVSGFGTPYFPTLRDLVLDSSSRSSATNVNINTVQASIVLAAILIIF